MLSLKECQALIDSSLSELYLPGEPFNLYDPIRYILETGGKRLRPSLVIMGCNVYNDDVSAAVYPSLAFEVFHNFTLMHDDIMDNSPLRRNRPTVHVKWTGNIAILSGDAMLIKAYELLSGSPENKVAGLLRIFNSTALRLCEGQQYDLDFEHKLEITIDDYLKMIQLKTSALIAGALEAGAFIGGATVDDMKNFREFGNYLGIAFQIQDDWLDLYSEENSFGKAKGNDVVTNKKTILMVRALQLAKGLNKEKLISWIGKKDFIPDEKIRAVKAIFEELNIKELTAGIVEDYYNKALTCLGTIDVPEEKKSVLYSVAKTLLGRKS
jgi:geranylgeranyl diphosphate synthase, type II